MFFRLPITIFAALCCGLLQARAESDTWYRAPYAQPAAADENQPAAGITHGGSEPTVRGSRAIVCHGVAYAPASAPERVKRAIWAANSLRRKPYKWGGGHGSFSDSGYDCSGTVCFALHSAGLIDRPVPASDLQRYGERGRGRWITVYSRSGHTFAVIAGLRLDTTGCYGTEGPRWHAEGRDTGGYEARHPAGM